MNCAWAQYLVFKIFIMVKGIDNSKYMKELYLSLVDWEELLQSQWKNVFCLRKPYFWENKWKIQLNFLSVFFLTSNTDRDILIYLRYINISISNITHI